ncbi:MAG: amidohydrolase family protein [Sphingomonas sp.]
MRDAAFEPHKDRLLLAVGWPPESLVKKQKGFVQLGEEAGLSAQLVADEFERQLTVDGARMIGENAGSAVRGLLGRVSAKELGPVVDVLLKHDVPIAFHTGWTPTGSARSTATARPYETASHWAEAIGSFLTNFPDVKTILTHTGGQFGDLDGSEALRLLYSFDNVYCDTSKAPPRIVQAAVAGIGAERVMFGSDWNRPDLKTYGPYFMRASYQHWYNLNTIAIADITEDQRDWVLYRSAHKLLKLDA